MHPVEESCGGRDAPTPPNPKGAASWWSIDPSWIARASARRSAPTRPSESARPLLEFRGGSQAHRLYKAGSRMGGCTL